MVQKRVTCHPCYTSGWSIPCRMALPGAAISWHPEALQGCQRTVSCSHSLPTTLQSLLITQSCSNQTSLLWHSAASTGLRVPTFLFMLPFSCLNHPHLVNKKCVCFPFPYTQSILQEKAGQESDWRFNSLTREISSELGMEPIIFCLFSSIISGPSI